MGAVFRSVGKDARIELANFITRSISFFSVLFLFAFFSREYFLFFLLLLSFALFRTMEDSNLHSLLCSEYFRAARNARSCLELPVLRKFLIICISKRRDDDSIVSYIHVHLALGIQDV